MRECDVFTLAYIFGSRLGVHFTKQNGKRKRNNSNGVHLICCTWLKQLRGEVTAPPQQC